MLPGAGLGDYPALPHSLGEERLAERAVDLVRAGVVQVLALQVHVAADLGGEPGRGTERRRPADILLEQSVEFARESCVANGFVECRFELVERGDQRLGDVPSAERAKAVRGIGRH